MSFSVSIHCDQTFVEELPLTSSVLRVRKRGKGLGKLLSKFESLELVYTKYTLVCYMISQLMISNSALMIQVIRRTTGL
jgi:hypothetical protein